MAVTLTRLLFYMINLQTIFGRLGNNLFQFATLYAKSRDEGVDYYFQDSRYFDKYEDEIKLLFGQDIKPIDMVSIHVRHAANPINPSEPKYSENPFYVNLCETTYYEEAMEQFPGADFLMFSDDIKWCKEHFKQKRITFCEEKDEIKALNLMSGCEHNIIANSSFSWFAAYLNPNKSKVVIAPAEYYTDGVQRTVYPVDWIVI